MDFERIDINQCPLGEGNKGPNHFADTARCKKETTECEPLHGWGFRRGGYQCRCKPGWRLPNTVRRPFLGEVLERASAEQYYNEYDCLKIGCKLEKIQITIKSINVLPLQGFKSCPYSGTRRPITYAKGMWTCTPNIVTTQPVRDLYMQRI